MCTAHAGALDPELNGNAFLMPAWILPAALAAGQAIVGAVGQGKANEGNRAEARRSRAFAERMSSTAYVRSRKDMVAAGLNPALMYGSGGAASSPSAAAATGQQSVTKDLSPGISSAMGVKRLQAEIGLLEAQTEKTKGEAMGTRVSGLEMLDRWQRMNDQGGRDVQGGPVTTPNTRTLQRMFEAEFDKKISESDAVKIRNVLMKLQQPGAEASASLMKEIGDLNPGARAALMMLMGVLGRGTIPGG